MLQNWMRLLPSPLIAASALLLFAATATDIAARRVPNIVPALLAAVGLTLRARSGTLAGGALAAATVFALAFLCWRRGWLGGGDVKLLAAATLAVPPLLAPSLVLAVALAGGALAILYVLLGSTLPPARPRPASPRARLLARLVRRERRRIERRAPVPYAAAIAAGTIFVLIRR